MGNATFAGTGGKEEDAPIPDIPALANGTRRFGRKLSFVVHEDIGCP